MRRRFEMDTFDEEELQRVLTASLTEERGKEAALGEGEPSLGASGGPELPDPEPDEDMVKQLVEMGFTEAPPFAQTIQPQEPQHMALLS